MDILFLLVPVSVLLALGVIAVLAWAVWSGQFEDVEKEAVRILLDDKQAVTATGAGAEKRADKPTAHD